MKLSNLKPREGWRAFVGEVGVIVLGVLIALAAQQLVDEWRWRQTVKRTKADLDDQIRLDIANIAERAAVDQCLSARLHDLAEKVAQSCGEWKGDPYSLPGERTTRGIVHFAVPVAYRAPQRTFPVDVWEQAKAGSVLSQMKPADIAIYASIFADIGYLSAKNTAEYELASELSFLSFDGLLAPQDRTRALSTISRLDNLNQDIAYSARLIVKNAVRLGGKFSANDEKVLFDNLETQRQLRGPCVDRAAALKLIAPLRASKSQAN